MEQRAIGTSSSRLVRGRRDNSTLLNLEQHFSTTANTFRGAVILKERTDLRFGETAFAIILAGWSVFSFALGEIRWKRY
jgi:hypothetical protein